MIHRGYCLGHPWTTRLLSSAHAPCPSRYWHDAFYRIKIVPTMTMSLILKWNSHSFVQGIVFPCIPYTFVKRSSVRGWLEGNVAHALPIEVNRNAFRAFIVIPDESQGQLIVCPSLAGVLDHAICSTGLRPPQLDFKAMKRRSEIMQATRHTSHGWIIDKLVR